jgi:hypothetical protein
MKVRSVNEECDPAIRSFSPLLHKMVNELLDFKRTLGELCIELKKREWLHFR